MKNYFPMLLFCALALTVSTMTSCEKEINGSRQYAITLSVGLGGRVEAKVDGKAVKRASEGVSVTLTATPDEGYTFSHWTVETGGMTLSGNPATFSMPAENVSLRAEFAEEVTNVYDKIADPGFLYYCQEVAMFDTNNDGILSPEEAQVVTEINVNEWHKLLGSPIRSLAGIEYFTSLTLLTCYGNAITEIDLSKNTELTYLHVGTNGLVKLDVTKNTKLVELYVSRNAISEIDLSHCPNLEKFECNQCGDLASLDVSNNPKLTHVSAEQCPKITALDFSKNPEMVILRCFQGNLTSIDVSNCKKLEALNCFDNQLTSVNVANCSAMTVFDCSNNRLTSLDISKATSLSYFMCYKNRMAALDASMMSDPDDFDLGCGAQTTDGSTPQTLKLTLREEQKPQWQYNMVPYQDMNANVELMGGSADIFGKITDPIFKTYCEQFDTDHDGKLTQEEASAVTEINVPQMGISSLAGVEYFVGITKLICNNNNLTSLATTYNYALAELVCNDNQLTELIINKKINSGEALTTLSCQNNQLPKLSVAGCKKLKTVNCQNNKITELNMYLTGALSSVNCSNNLLTSLDFYMVNTLVSFMCQNNKLTELNLSNKKTLMSLMCNNNLLTSLNISGCTSLMGVMAYENRLTALDASDMSTPNGYNLFCGNQTSDGVAAQTLKLTLREEQKPHWESVMKGSSLNDGVILAE